MVSETFVSGIMTASVTGAGLVIAYYAFVAAMANRIFQRRAEKLEQKHDEIRRIRENTQAFETLNLGDTSRKLKNLSDDVNAITAFPSYLGYFVFADFVLFCASALFAFNWLATDPALRTNGQWVALAIMFLAAIAVLIGVGGSGIVEVYRTMEDRFDKLKQRKKDAQREASLGRDRAQG